MVALAHFSDLHLGYNQYNFGPLKDARYYWTLQSFKEAGRELNHLNQLKPSFIVVSGDIFHHNNITVESLLEWLDIDYAAMCLNTKIVVIGGNHDNKYKWHRLFPNTIMLDQTTPSYISNNMLIYGINFSDVGIDIEAAISKALSYSNSYSLHPKILIMHGAVEKSVPFDAAISLANLEKLRLAYDYVGIGHVHSRNQWYDNVYQVGSLIPTNRSDFIRESSLPIHDRAGWNLVEFKNKTTAPSVTHFYAQPIYAAIKYNELSDNKKVQELIDNKDLCIVFVQDCNHTVNQSRISSQLKTALNRQDVKVVCLFNKIEADLNQSVVPEENKVMNHDEAIEHFMGEAAASFKRILEMDPNSPLDTILREFV